MSKQLVATNGKNAMGLFTDRAKLLAAIAQSHKNRAKQDKIDHVLAVSAVYMIAKDGTTKPLNELYNGLKGPMQQALRAWVAYIASDLSFPLGMGQGGGFIRAFSKDLKEKAEDEAGYFRVVNGAKAQRDHFMNNVEVVLACGMYPEFKLAAAVMAELDEKSTPKPKKLAPFTEHRLTAQNVNVFVPKNILATLMNLKAKAEKEENNIPMYLRNVLDKAVLEVSQHLEANPELDPDNEPQVIEHQPVAPIVQRTRRGARAAEMQPTAH